MTDRVRRKGPQIGPNTAANCPLIHASRTPAIMVSLGHLSACAHQSNVNGPDFVENSRLDKMINMLWDMVIIRDKKLFQNSILR